MEPCTHTLPFNPLARTIAPACIDLTTLTVADPIDEAELRDLAERNTEIYLAVKAARAADALQPTQESACQFICDHLCADYPAWDLLADHLAEIRALPGSALAFRDLLIHVELFRFDNPEQRFLNPEGGFVAGKLMTMIRYLTAQARFEMAVYDYSTLKNKGTFTTEEIENRFGYTEAALSVPKEQVYRPADIYRAYGLALRYATEELGSFDAREVLARLMLATPLPVDELENPDWIDPYTGEQDGDYTFLKVKEPSVSDVGNDLPVMIQDMLDGLSQSEQRDFEECLKKASLSLDDYYREYLEAQRGGFVNLPEPDEDREEPEFDVIEKDFQYAEDLKVSELVEKVKEGLVLTTGHGPLDLLAGLKEVSTEMALQAREAWAGQEKFDFDAAHVKFLRDPRVRAFLRQFQKLCWKYPLPDLMACLLPFQNSFGLWEEDLYDIKVPGTFRTLAHWYSINGEEFLEQFINRDDVDYGDKAVNQAVGKMRFIPRGEPTQEELEQFTWDVYWDQDALYQRAEQRRQQWFDENRWPSLFRELMDATIYERFMLLTLNGESMNVTPEIQVFKYRADASWTAAFISAELMAAIMGDGGSQSAKAAGWDAWRDSMDREANAAYKKARRDGAEHKDAMQKFWAVWKINQNKIARINKDGKGVTLRSGRVIDWGITLLKLRGSEIVMNAADCARLLDLLRQKKWGTPALCAYLQKSVELAH